MPRVPPVTRVLMGAAYQTSPSAESAAGRRRCAGSSRQVPPGVEPRDGGRRASLPQDAGEPQEVRRDACGALHPADAGWEQRVVVAVLGEAPAGAVSLHHRALDERVTEDLGERQVVVDAEPLPGVE